LGKKKSRVSTLVIQRIVANGSAGFQVLAAKNFSINALRHRWVVANSAANIIVNTAQSVISTAVGKRIITSGTKNDVVAASISASTITLGEGYRDDG